ncbi:hypothetical protein [Nesterenkonia alba]|uniref:hypothetical protein n=1 Tax=Nesterenkonia alba TaxID=515814 RepID=UPI00040BAD73|nr:hypothetical protein [Nesterenkonia alba]
MEWVALALFVLAILFAIPFGIGMAVGYPLGKRKGRRETQNETVVTPSTRPSVPPRGSLPYGGPQDAGPQQGQPWGGAPGPDPSWQRGGTPSAAPSVASDRLSTESRVINVALYIGGLLITAAALSFVAVVQNAAVTAIALLAAFLLFAAAGYLLAVAVPMLKPAGLALFGTSLALFAVAAVPVNQAFIGFGQLTWLIFSLGGLVIYGAAAVHLDSRLLGYLVIPFLYSALFSSTAVIQPALVVTLTAIILLCTLVQTAILALGERVPTVLRRPFGHLHWAVIPGVILACVLIGDELGSFDYTIIFTAATFYYTVSAVRPPAAGFTGTLRIVYAMAARAAATAALISLMSGFDADLQLAVLMLSLWCLLVHLSVVYGPERSRNGQGVVSQVARSASLGTALFLIAGGHFLLHIELSSRSESGLYEHLWVIAVMLVALLICFHELLHHRPERARRWVLRAFFGAAVLGSVFFTPLYAVAWMILWMLTELLLSRREVLLVTQRILAVGLAAVVGWAVVDATEDVGVFSAVLLIVLLLTLTNEALTPAASRSPAVSLAHAISAGVLASVLALIAIFSDGLIVQVAPLAGAVAMIVFGMIRGSRTGAYWGAVIIVLSVLWSLRDTAWAVIAVLGLLLISAGVWRLIVIQRRGVARHHSS